MAIKIGDMLVNGGLITTNQLDEALQNQVMFGGKLGTNFIEMGIIDEEALSYFLSQKLGVPYVHPTELEEISEKIISLIPREIVEKHKVLPVAMGKNRLKVAMNDPTDLQVIDEISFLINKRIQQVIAPEVRLIMAFEKYYDIEKDMRYVSLVKNEKKPLSVVPSSDGMENFEFHKAQSGKEEKEDIEIADDNYAAKDKVKPTTASKKKIIEKYSVDDISRGMANAGKRDEVAALLIDYINQTFKKAAILILLKNEVISWKSSGDREFVGLAGKLRLPLAEYLPFKKVFNSKKCHLESVSKNPLTARGTCSESELIIPIIIKGAVVSFLFIAGEESKLKEKSNEYDGIAKKSALAFQMLVLKNKILMP